MSDRYRRGIDIAHQLAPGSLDDFCSGRVAEIAPEFARMVIEFTFGDLYTRQELDLRTREIIAIVALASLGHSNQLRQHVAAGLSNGLGKAAIVEVLMQSAVYAGFPAALNALADCHDLLTDDDLLDGGR